MIGRGLWFVAGAGAGAYAVVKVRRAAEAFTPEGLGDRLSALGTGAQLFAEEVRAGMTEKETELRERLGWGLDGPRELQAGVGFETLAGARSSTSGDSGARSSTSGDSGARSSTTTTTTIGEDLAELTTDAQENP